MNDSDEADDDPGDEVDDAPDAADDAPEGAPSARWRSELTSSRPPPPPPAEAENRARFRATYAEHEQFVWRMLKRADISPASASDVHQNVFVTLHRLIQARGFPQNVEAMLVEITGHEMCNHSRTRARRARFDDDAALEDLPAGDADPEEQAKAAELTRLMHAVIDTMTTNDAMLIQLIDVEERTLAEVAAKLGRKDDTLRKAHARARSRFEERLIAMLRDAGRDGGGDEKG